MPRLETERLLLRPPESGDAPAIARWLGDYEIAKNMATIPYPLTTRDAEHLVLQAMEDQAKGEAYVFAIIRKDSGRFMGLCSLVLSAGIYQLEFCLGAPFQNQGYATEAAKKVAAFAFHVLKAESIEAQYFDDDPAAAEVLGKLGFRVVESDLMTAPARLERALVHRLGLNRTAFGRKRPVQAARRLPAECCLSLGG